MKRIHSIVGLVLALVTGAPASADELPVITVGALQYGTVSWELDVIQHHGFDEAEGVRVEVRPMGSKNAASVALQSGAVDVIVSDWLWVSRQRHRGRPWTFHPWSMAVGAVMADADSGIESVADLEGRRLGVAGGPVDKSWLLLRAWYRQEHGHELAPRMEPVFGSPPLLNELALRGELPAVINYWHYSARLDAAGMEPLMEVERMLPALGIEAPVPLLGWVFSETWARENRDVVRSFLAASATAKARLADSEAEWRRLRERTKAEDDATLAALRDAFRAGIPQSFGRAEIEAARKLFDILAAEGGESLTGGTETLAEGTFWTPKEGSGAWQP